MTSAVELSFVQRGQELEVQGQAVQEQLANVSSLDTFTLPVLDYNVRVITTYNVTIVREHKGDRLVPTIHIQAIYHNHNTKKVIVPFAIKALYTCTM